MDPVAQFAKRGPQARYLRGLPGHPRVSVPRHTLREVDEDVRQVWAEATARTLDAMHNSGWVAGAVDQMCALVVGDRLRPNLKPDFSWLGWDASQSQAWAAQAERIFTSWAEAPWECDASGRHSLGQLQAAALRGYFAAGEALAQFPLIERPGKRWRTSVRMLPASALSRRTAEHERIMGGVVLDRYGAPEAYLLEVRDPITGHTAERRVSARDRFGRVLLSHVFDGMTGQVRGITPFAPVLAVLRNYVELSNATLQASMLHAIFAATIKSDYPTGDVLSALRRPDEDAALTDPDAPSRFDTFMDQKVGWHEHVDLNLGAGGRVTHLMLGEELDLKGAQHPNSAYEAFSKFLLREIARCIGVTFEDLTGDYSSSTYSSVRMSIAKQWPIVMARRNNIVAPFSQTALENVLEEAVDDGALPLPGGVEAFVAFRSQICRTEWRGPPKPQADDFKTQRALAGYRDMGVMSDEAICAELGSDVHDVYQQRAYEARERERLGIPHGGPTYEAPLEDDEEGE